MKTQCELLSTNEILMIDTVVLHSHTKLAYELNSPYRGIGNAQKKLVM